MIAMKYLRLSVIIIAAAGWFCFADGILTIKTTKDDALYKVSQKAVFAVTSTAAVDIEYTLTLDGKDVLGSGKMSVSDKPARIEGTLDSPGFLRCTIKYTDPQTKKLAYAVAAAGFEPEKIVPAFDDVPEDFDTFWNDRKAELACIPMQPVMEKIASADAGIEIFDVKVRCIGMPVSGYYARAADAQAGKCPAILFMQGAGVSSAGTIRITDYVKSGFIAMEINAHGLPNGEDKAYYEQLNTGKLFNYRHWGKESPYTSYFTGMFLRAVRALEFLKSQPQWDGKVLVAYGSSQGGAQALAAAGLDGDVNIIMTGVAAMCDHSGVINGWPRMVLVEKDGSYNKQVSESTRYIDCVNFARRTKAYGIFTVGFIDEVCRPTSVYAAFNSYGGGKEMINEPLMTHAFPQTHSDAVKAKILARIRD